MSKYNEERVAPLINLIKKGIPITHACAAVGIDKKTFYNWLQSFPEFHLRVKNAESELIEANINAIRAAGVRSVKDDKGKIIGVKGDWKANAWIAERRFPKEFGQHQKVEHDIGENTIERIMKAAAAKREEEKKKKAEKELDDD